MTPRFTIRDLLWCTAVVALSAFGFTEQSRLHKCQQEMDLWKDAVISRWNFNDNPLEFRINGGNWIPRTTRPEQGTVEVRVAAD